MSIDCPLKRAALAERCFGRTGAGEPDQRGAQVAYDPFGSRTRRSTLAALPSFWVGLEGLLAWSREAGVAPPPQAAGKRILVGIGAGA